MGAGCVAMEMIAENSHCIKTRQTTLRDHPGKEGLPMSQFAPDNLKVPPGFEHLLEGLAREVLREQPPNIIDFAAYYFRVRLAERDSGKKREECEIAFLVANT